MNSFSTYTISPPPRRELSRALGDSTLPQRRRSVRRSRSLRCQAVRLDGFFLVSTQILDLSTRGLLIACDDEVRIGDDLLVSFRAPGHGPTIDALGTVDRIVEGFRRGDRGYCAGVQFTQIDAASRGELLVRLAGVPPPVPARRRFRFLRRGD